MFDSTQMHNILRRALAIAITFSLLCFSLAVGASGALDTTFSGDGKIKMDIIAGQNNRAMGVAIQSDGKIVTVGETNPTTANHNIALTRYTTSGALDTTFNGTGKKVTDLGGLDQGIGIAINQANGKIVVAGQTCNDASLDCDSVVLRYNKNGSLDKLFNTIGYRIDDFGGDDNGSFGAVAIQTDGKIVVGGYMNNTTSGNYDFVVSRYTTTGALDNTFNKTGVKTVSFSGGLHEYINGMTIQPDGKIIVAGNSCNSEETKCNFAIARLNSNGTLDMTFNTTGKRIVDFGAVDRGNSIALQTDGKIIMAGIKTTSTTSNFALARLNPNGTMDTTFAGTGKKVIDISGSGKPNGATMVRIFPGANKFLAGGFSDGNFALARFTSTGKLDLTFNSTGKVSIDFGGDESCRAFAVQPADGKYVLVGFSFDGSVRHWAVARVLP